MSQHFDTMALRDAYRQSIASALAEGRSKARTPEALKHIDLQEKFSVLLVEASAIGMEARNMGRPEHMIATALGAAIGTIAGNYMANMVTNLRPLDGLAMYDEFCKLMKICIAGERNTEGMSSSEVRFEPMQGGHA